MRRGGGSSPSALGRCRRRRRRGRRRAACWGRRTPAKGTPVKIGVISNGKTPTIDNSHETPVAEATAKWINEYQGGIGGHPIQLVICNDGNEPGQGRRLREPDDPGEGRRGRDRAERRRGELVAPAPRRRDPGVQLRRPATRAWRADTDVDVHGRPTPRASLFGLPAGVAKKAKAKKVSAVDHRRPGRDVAIYKEQAPAAVQGAGPRLRAHPRAGRYRRHDPADAAAWSRRTRRAPRSSSATTRSASRRSTGCAPPASRARSRRSCSASPTRPGPRCRATSSKGMQISSFSPITNPKDPSIKQYYAVLDKYGATDVDRSNTVGMAMFNTLGAFGVATRRAQGRGHAGIDHRRHQVDAVVGRARHGRAALPLQRQGRPDAAGGVLERDQRRDAGRDREGRRRTRR